MSKQLQTTSIVAPGFFGLNTQESGVTLSPGYAVQATNCVIDKFGRLGSRRGWAYRTSSLDTVADDNVGVELLGLHNFIDLAGVKTYLSWNATTFFKGFSDLTTITPTTTDTITTGKWQAVSLNDRAYFFQEGYKPLLYTNESTADEFKTIDTHADYTGTVPQGSIALSAYGRLWVASTSTNKTTVYFSDLLDGVKWGSGSAGSINIAGTFSTDSDVITGLAAHNGYLVVFCRNSIIIFGDTDSFQGSFDVTTLQLVEVIEGVGCIAKDTISNTGDDILFLSASGLRSLSRTIQEKSQPLNDLSKNIRDDLIDLIEAQSDLSSVRGIYVPRYAFYLLSFPNSGFAYCFDTRVPLEDGSLRTTFWDKQTHNDFMYDTSTRQLFLVETDGIAEYFGFTDNGSSYRFTYFTSYFDLDQPNITKIIKQAAITIIGPRGQSFVTKLGYDYDTIFRSYPFSLSAGGTVYEYNESEYTVAEYNGGLQIEKVKSSVGGSGTVVQLGFETAVNGAPLSIQRLDVFGKTGRII